MSKRFEELWAKANTQWVEEFEQAAEPRMCRTARDIFAELIVRECAELMYGRDENGNCKDGDVIKEHFGVEE